MESRVHPTAIVCPGANIGSGVTIEAFSYVGFSYSGVRDHMPPEHPGGSNKSASLELHPPIIGDGTFVGPYVVIGPGVTIGKNCLIEAQTYIGAGVTIGDDCFIRYGCKVYDHTSIGTKCVLSGFLCNDTVVGNRVESHASCIHGPIGTVRRPSGPSPRILDDAFVAWGAVLVGGVTIGREARVKVGALVTRDVPEGGVVDAQSQHST